LPEVRSLIIDDEVEVGTFFRRLLSKKDYGVTVAVNGEEAERCINEQSFDVAMVDLKLPDTDGLSLLRLIKKSQPECEVIIMTGYSTTRTAVKAIQLGAFDYLEKPFEDIGEVEVLIQKAAEYGMHGYGGRLKNAEWYPVAEQLGFQVGTSEIMHKLVSIAYKIAGKNINVLIQGETGTGKEILARFIHAASNRSGQIFIPVNCGALPENLLESELFGHEKGSFTGAFNLRKGIFELANRGTLFLDEVGESSLSIQVKLLRVLETGEFLRVGGEKPIKTDVRIITATNIDLEQSLKEKTFREDLFYRLDVVRLELPPLRARREDIPLLAEYFLKRLNPELFISVDTMDILCNYQWPGNIRELANTISQAAALCDGKFILPEHISDKLLHGTSKINTLTHENPGTGENRYYRPQPKKLEDILKERFTEDALVSLDDTSLVSIAGMLPGLQDNLTAAMRKKGIQCMPPPSLKQIETKAIQEALSYYQGNITMAAKSLGIGRNTLYRKIKDYNIVNWR